MFLLIRPSKNHEKTTFRASLEPQGPRDRACGKEREILFRIALTRALYDEMAPQLCPLYVPGKLSFSSLVFVAILAPFGLEEITTGKTGNTHCLRSGLKSIGSLPETLPVFPVVIFRHISRDKGQKAGPHDARMPTLRWGYNGGC